MLERHQVSALAPAAFDEQHYPIRHWSNRWGFSQKTIREWFRDEYGPGILRQPNVGRRSKRDLHNDYDLAKRGSKDLLPTNRGRGE